eukprot:2722387-Pyramimonas_sp.AAC.1
MMKPMIAMMMAMKMMMLMLMRMTITLFRTARAVLSTNRKTPQPPWKGAPHVVKHLREVGQRHGDPCQ